VEPGTETARSCERRDASQALFRLRGGHVAEETVGDDQVLRSQHLEIAALGAEAQDRPYAEEIASFAPGEHDSH
jgi:hypothetical protein